MRRGRTDGASARGIRHRAAAPGVAAVLVAAALVGSLGPGPARAQIYRWSDDGGQVNYSQGLDSVPERYRAAATPLSFPPVLVDPPRPEPSRPGSGELARCRSRPASPSGSTRA